MNSELPTRIHEDRRRKLTHIEVREIQCLVLAGCRQADLAVKYGVSRSWISQLTKRAHDLYDFVDRAGADESDLRRELAPELFRMLTAFTELESAVRAYKNDFPDPTAATQARETVRD